jgi:hypothetical protein
MLFGLCKTAEKLKKSGAELWSKTYGAQHHGLDCFCTEKNSSIISWLRDYTGSSQKSGP